MWCLREGGNYSSPLFVSLNSPLVETLGKRGESHIITEWNTGPRGFVYPCDYLHVPSFCPASPWVPNDLPLAPSPPRIKPLSPFLSSEEQLPGEFTGGYLFPPHRSPWKGPLVPQRVPRLLPCMAFLLPYIRFCWVCVSNGLTANSFVWQHEKHHQNCGISRVVRLTNILSWLDILPLWSTVIKIAINLVDSTLTEWSESLQIYVGCSLGHAKSISDNKTHCH